MFKTSCSTLYELSKGADYTSEIGCCFQGVSYQWLVRQAAFEIMLFHTGRLSAKEVETVSVMLSPALSLQATR